MNLTLKSGMITDYNKYNSDVSVFGKKLGNKLRYKIRTLSKKGKGDLVRSLRMKKKMFYGEIDNLTYSFERHGIFWHKGVGGGYKIIGGRLVRVQTKGKLLRSGKDEKSILPSNAPIRRKPVEWFNPILDANIPELANIVASHHADRAVDATEIKIR